VRINIILLLIIVNLYGWEDGDMDGVANIDDLCPYTTFEYLVDKNGCPIDGNYKGRLSLIIGTKLNIDDSIDSSVDYDFFINYSYKLWSLSLYTSQESTDENKLSTGDLYLSLNYNIINKNFRTKLSIGTKLATGDEEISTNEIDYFTSLSLNYIISSDFILISQLYYTITGDSENISYKNPIGYSIGANYTINDKFDIKVLYQNSNSIYQDGQNYSSLSISNNYNFSDDIWATIGYSRGFDDLSYQNIFSFKLGVSFE
jgi:hypothetical protein